MTTKPVKISCVQSIIDKFLKMHNDMPQHTNNNTHHYSAIVPIRNKDWWYEKGGIWHKFNPAI